MGLILESYQKTQFLFFGSLSILIAVVVYFVGPVYQVSQSPGGLAAGTSSSPFYLYVSIAFLILGVALLVYGYVVKNYSDMLKL